MAESVKVSKPIVDAAGPDAAEYTLWDSEVPGQYGKLTLDDARKEARKALANAKGPHLTNASKPWRDIRTKAKICDLRPHDLRHHFASVGAGGGLSLYQVANLLGHTQAVTTQRYAHLQPDGPREAANRIAGEIAADLAGKPPAKVAKLTPKKGSR